MTADRPRLSAASAPPLTPPLAEPSRSPVPVAPRPLRVLQVTAVDFTVAKILAPLASFLASRGCRVAVACARGEYWERLVAGGLELVEIPFRRSFDLVAHARAARHLRRHLRRAAYDVVHVHTPVAALIGRWAAARARVPIVLYTAHGFHFHDGMGPWTHRFHVELERRAARWHHHLFTQSAEDREAALALGIARPEGVTWIGNGVDLDRFDAARFGAAELAALRRQLGLAAAGPVVVLVARLVAEKGLRELVDAAAAVHAEVPEARFLVVGAAVTSDRDAIEGELRQRIRDRGLEGVVLLAGARDDVPQLLALSSVFALPSYREGVPRSAIEAMAMGLPTVMTDIRGCREETVEGETGFLVPVGDAQALADRLLRLLRDPDLARRMGEAARRRARALFDERQVLERQWRVLAALARERGLLSDLAAAGAGA